MISHLFSKIVQKDFVQLIFGSFILAIAINIFIVPHNLAFGGITGTTIIIQSLTGIPIYLSNFFLSAVVILAGWFDLGHEFMIKTIVPTAALPLFLLLTVSFSEFSVSLPVSIIMGAITIGTGISIIILAGGSTAGPDTIGLMLKKHFKIPITLTMLTVDLLVILCGYGIYGVDTAIYSISVAVLMNISVKLVRDILSSKIFFRYWHKFTNIKKVASKS